MSEALRRPIRRNPRLGHAVGRTARCFTQRTYGLELGAGDAGMSTPANRQLVGHWRVVKADIWDRDHLRPRGLATDHSRGETAFGVLQAGLDIEYKNPCLSGCLT
jgi:hypothetical protein